jgi:hypothetical protein
LVAWIRLIRHAPPAMAARRLDRSRDHRSQVTRERNWCAASVPLDGHVRIRDGRWTGDPEVAARIGGGNLATFHADRTTSVDENQPWSGKDETGVSLDRGGAQMPRRSSAKGGLTIALFFAFACSGTSSVRTRTSGVRIRFPNATIPDGVAVAVTLAPFSLSSRMCSRPGPSSVTSYWEVSHDDVQRVDPALLEYLQTAPHETIAYEPQKFVRQYAGFRRGKHRFIYINAFPSDHLARMGADPSKAFLIGCDGGDIFWGIEYDVERGTFARLEVNSSLIIRR